MPALFLCRWLFIYLADACLAGQFDCTGTGNGNGTSCISAALVCNNIVNCPTGGLDENTAITCGKPKGTCATVAILNLITSQVANESQGTIIVCASSVQAM